MPKCVWGLSLFGFLLSVFFFSPVHRLPRFANVRFTRPFFFFIGKLSPFGFPATQWIASSVKCSIKEIEYTRTIRERKKKKKKKTDGEREGDEPSTRRVVLGHKWAVTFAFNATRLLFLFQSPSPAVFMCVLVDSNHEGVRRGCKSNTTSFLSISFLHSITAHAVHGVCICVCSYVCVLCAPDNLTSSTTPLTFLVPLCFVVVVLHLPRQGTRSLST